jgi:uncharacterized membrane protein YcaP (DUF421 family)
MFAVDWHAVLVPTVALAELVLRGSVVYLFIFVAMRILRREAGALSTADLLVVVLVADAAQNAMAAEYHSITEGVVLIGTIFGWNYALDWLSYRSPTLRKVLQPSPLPLIKNGRIMRRNLKSELMTVDDLNEQLREHGIGSINDVKLCYLEADGHIGVLTHHPRGTEKPEKAGVP